MRAARNYSIGELAQQAAVHVETIRYYERIGLLASPPRTEGGHRLYSEAHLKELNFIRRSRDMGFTLQEIRHLLNLVMSGNACGEVQKAAQKRLKDIRLKLAALHRTERALTELSSRCDGGTSRVCPIVDVLSRR